MSAAARRVAAFDIGSNTVKYTAVEIRPDRRIESLAEDAIVTRLSRGLAPGGVLDPSAVDRTLAALRTMLDAVRALGIDDIRAVATAGLRRAEDPDTFIGRAREELGLEVRVIDGRTEAELAFAGATSVPDGEDRPAVVIDIGGRSTEIAVGRGRTMERFISLDVGTISLTEDHLSTDPPDPSSVEALRRAARETLEDAPSAPDEARLLGVSGTVLALAGRSRGISSMRALSPVVEDEPLLADTVAVQLAELARLRAADRELGDVLPEGRADVIVAGAALLLEIMQRYRCEAMKATPRGLRWGLLAG